MLALEKIHSGFHYYNVGYGKATDLNTLIDILQKYIIQILKLITLKHEQVILKNQ